MTPGCFISHYHTGTSLLPFSAIAEGHSSEKGFCSDHSIYISDLKKKKGYKDLLAKSSIEKNEGKANGGTMRAIPPPMGTLFFKQNSFL